MQPEQEISIQKPGAKRLLPGQIIKQLRLLDPIRFRNREVTFFGGHPVSMTKKEINKIFDEVVQGKSPYLVCEKTDGIRYLLIVTNKGNYFVSRQGSKTLVAYQAKCRVSASSWQKGNGQFEQIMHILDGEMIKDKVHNSEKIRYLIFDALVIFNKLIIKQPLKERLKKITKFYQCNQYILESDKQASQNKVDVKIKDFFRLSCNTYVSSEVMIRRKLTAQPTTVEFLFDTYMKCLPHQNDGIIFNHENLEYILGTNPGYVKWKPAHLNTVDFLITPNTNLQQKFGPCIIDLYLGQRDEDNSYKKLFYSFAVVEQGEFQLLQNIEQAMYERNISQDSGVDVTDQFFGIIAQCKYESTNERQQSIFRKLYSRDRTKYEIREEIMKKKNEEKQLDVVDRLLNQTYIKSWKIFRHRKDKNMPNNHAATNRIEESIRDDIQYERLLKGNRQLMDKILVSRQF